MSLIDALKLSRASYVISKSLVKLGTEQDENLKRVFREIDEIKADIDLNQQQIQQLYNTFPPPIPNIPLPPPIPPPPETLPPPPPPIPSQSIPLPPEMLPLMPVPKPKLNDAIRQGTPIGEPLESFDFLKQIREGRRLRKVEKVERVQKPSLLDKIIQRRIGISGDNDDNNDDDDDDEISEVEWESRVY